MKDLVAYLVRNLTDRPDKVEVSESEHNNLMTLKLAVAEEDKGKVIGRQGKVIKAIRAVVAAAASKQGKKTFVELAKEECP